MSKQIQIVTTGIKKIIIINANQTVCSVDRRYEIRENGILVANI